MVKFSMAFPPLLIFLGGWFWDQVKLLLALGQ